MQDFEEAYRQYFDNVYRFLLSLSGNHHIADELTQETFLRALLRIGTYKEDGHFQTWLFTIAKNLWLSECRRHKHETESEDDLPDPSPTPEERTIESERRRALIRAVLELPEDHRDVILLHIYGGLPLREIARQKGRSESWGKVTYYRARQLLTQKLEAYQ